MIGIVIGASSDSLHAIQIAQKLGIYVVALDGNPEAPGLKMADKSEIVDISDKEAVNQVVQRIKPDFTIPIPIGRYLSTMGYINEKYSLPGVKEEATCNSTDKFLFHQLLHKKDLRNEDAYLVNADSDGSNIEISYPAILKPRFGSGSRDVYWLSTKEGWNSSQKMKDAIQEEDFVLEEAVQGQEYGVDGAVINGKTIITLIRKKIITPLPVRQAISSVAVVREENQAIYEAVEKYLTKVDEVLGYDECLINADIILNEEGIFLIEIAPRPSGHSLHNVFCPLATGVDLVEEYLKYLLKKEYSFSASTVRCLQIHYFNFENEVIQSVPDEKVLRESKQCNLVAWNCNIQEGEYMDKVINGHSIMGRGYFVVEGKNEEDLAKQCQWILEQFERKEDSANE